MKWESPINTKGKHPQALTECHIFDIEDIYGNIPRSSPDMIFEGQSLTIKVIELLGSLVFLQSFWEGLCTL